MTRKRRNGFTLFEVLTVLGVIVLVGAISWPIYTSWLERERLNDGAEKVRESWLKARSLAMQHGKEYRFGIQNQQPAIEPLLSPGMQTALDVEPLPNGVKFVKICAGPMSECGGLEGVVVVFRPEGTVQILGPDGIELADVQLIVEGQGGQVISLHGRSTGEIAILNLGAN